MKHRLKALLAASAFCLFLSACRTTRQALPPMPESAIRPVVAVTEFENRSGFSGQWQIGAGISDLLVADLLRTDRVVVVDRKHIGGVLDELLRQGRDLFRKEDRVERGRLKNARYLIRGVITDFTQTRSASGWFRSPGAEVGRRGARAVVMIQLTLTDVETGQIICSIPAEGTARASSNWVKFNYNKTSFGGDLFFRSPVGRATQDAVRKAVVSIVQHIPYATWEARIADAIGDMVIVNGGANVNIRQGDIFDVREARRPITDPTTGDIIDRLPGKTVGSVKITNVGETSSEGILLSGEARRGHFLEQVW